MITAHLTWLGFALHTFCGVTGAIYWIRRGARALLARRSGDS